MKKKTVHRRNKLNKQLKRITFESIDLQRYVTAYKNKNETIVLRLAVVARNKSFIPVRVQWKFKRFKSFHSNNNKTLTIFEISLKSCETELHNLHNVHNFLSLFLGFIGYLCPFSQQKLVSNGLLLFLVKNSLSFFSFSVQSSFKFCNNLSFYFCPGRHFGHFLLGFHFVIFALSPIFTCVQRNSIYYFLRLRLYSLLRIGLVSPSMSLSHIFLHY